MAGMAIGTSFCLRTRISLYVPQHVAPCTALEQVSSTVDLPRIEELRMRVSIICDRIVHLMRSFQLDLDHAGDFRPARARSAARFSPNFQFTVKRVDGLSAWQRLCRTHSAGVAGSFRHFG